MKSFREGIILFLVIVALLFSMQAKSEVVVLQPNQKAPYFGYLFDHETMKKATTESMQLTEYKKLTEINMEIIKEQEKQLQNNEYMKYLYFIGGIVVGGAVVKAVQ